MKELFESSFINVISEENDELRKEVARLNKIIEEALYYLEIDMIGTAIDKLKELKEGGKNNAKNEEN